MIVTILVILGSIGFLVFQDAWDNFKGRRFRLQTHTKLVVVVTLIILVSGTMGITILEWNNPQTLQPSEYRRTPGHGAFPRDVPDRGLYDH